MGKAAICTTPQHKERRECLSRRHPMLCGGRFELGSLFLSLSLANVSMERLPQYYSTKMMIAKNDSKMLGRHMILITFTIMHGFLICVGSERRLVPTQASCFERKLSGQFTGSSSSSVTVLVARPVYSASLP